MSRSSFDISRRVSSRSGTEAGKACRRRSCRDGRGCCSTRPLAPDVFGTDGWRFRAGKSRRIHSHFAPFRATVRSRSRSRTAETLAVGHPGSSWREPGEGFFNPACAPTPEICLSSLADVRRWSNVELQRIGAAAACAEPCFQSGRGLGGRDQPANSAMRIQGRLAGEKQDRAREANVPPPLGRCLSRSPVPVGEPGVSEHDVEDRLVS